jgi:hypothetical protein
MIAEFVGGCGTPGGRGAAQQRHGVPELAQSGLRRLSPHRHQLKRSFGILSKYYAGRTTGNRMVLLALAMVQSCLRRTEMGHHRGHREYRVSDHAGSILWLRLTPGWQNREHP